MILRMRTQKNQKAIPEIVIIIRFYNGLVLNFNHPQIQ